MKKKINWKRVVERDAETLIVYQVSCGWWRLGEVLRIGYELKRMKYENKWYWLPEEELKKQATALKDSYQKDNKFFYKLADEIILRGKELVKFSCRLMVDFDNKDDKEIKELFKSFNEMFIKYMSYIWVFFPAQIILTAEMNEAIKRLFPGADESKQNKIFTLLTASHKKTEAAREYRDLLKVVVQSKKGRDKKIRKIYNQYAWLGMMRIGWSYLNEPYDMKHYNNVVLELEKADPQDKLRVLQRQETDFLRQYKAFIKKENLSKETLELCRLLQQYIFLHTFRGEQVVKSMFYARFLIKEIASRFDLELEDIVYFTPTEIIELFNTGKVPSFSSRKKGYTIFIKDNRIAVRGGAKTKKIKIKKVEELKGNVAQLGIAEGRVRIIFSAKEIKKVEKGDILITKMTSPDMMLAIHRAAAIVTDEGGVTCHAAIVSREFGIPCIVGTEKATQVFKDGDLVEVDAEKGLVRKIK